MARGDCTKALEVRAVLLFSDTASDERHKKQDLQGLDALRSSCDSTLQMLVATPEMSMYICICISNGFTTSSHMKTEW